MCEDGDGSYSVTTMPKQQPQQNNCQLKWLLTVTTAHSILHMSIVCAFRVSWYSNGSGPFRRAPHLSAGTLSTPAACHFEMKAVVLILEPHNVSKAGLL